MALEQTVGPAGEAPGAEPDEALLNSLKLLHGGNQEWQNVIARSLIAIGKTRRELAAGGLPPDLRQFTDQVVEAAAGMLSSDQPDRRKLGVEILLHLYFGEHLPE